LHQTPGIALLVERRKDGLDPIMMIPTTRHQTVQRTTPPCPRYFVFFPSISIYLPILSISLVYLSTYLIYLSIAKEKGVVTYEVDAADGGGERAREGRVGALEGSRALGRPAGLVGSGLQVGPASM
jgi:hypothetical protein